MAFKKWLNSKTLSWALSSNTVFNMESAWNAAIDEAIKVAYNADKSTHPSDLAESIKELKG